MVGSVRRFRLPSVAALAIVTVFTSATVTLVNFSSAFALPATVYVRTTGDNSNCDGTTDLAYPGAGSGLACAKATIKAGVAAVAPSGTVNVAAGHYHELQIEVWLNKGFTLQGAGASVTTIDGDNAAAVSLGNGVHPGTIYVKNPDTSVKIDGFTFINPVTTSGVITSIAIAFGSGAPTPPLITISNNHFIGVSTGSNNLTDNAIWVYAAPAGVVSHIENNEFENQWQSILLELPKGGAVVTGNNFHNLFTSGGFASQAMSLWQYDGTNVTAPVTISTNTFSASDGWSIVLRGSGNSQFINNVTIANNTITGTGTNSAGIVLRNPATTLGDTALSGIIGATISGNTITSSVAGAGIGIWLRGPNNNATITGGSITGFANGILSELYNFTNASSGVVVHENSLTENTVAVSNTVAGATSIDATNNWWGSADQTIIQSKISGNVNFVPYYITSAMIPTSAPGIANAIVTGIAKAGSALVAGNGDVTGFPAPTLTYAWSRGGTPISGATSGTYVVVDADQGLVITVVITATNGINPAATASASVTVEITPVTVVSPSFGPATFELIPEVDNKIDVQIQGTSTTTNLNISINIPKNSLTEETTVNVFSDSQFADIDSGFVSVRIESNRTSDNSEVTTFANAIEIRIPTTAIGASPAWSRDGLTWTLLPRLAAAFLPEGQSDGYFVNADGSYSFFTRHLTTFGLMRTQVPLALTSSNGGLKVHESVQLVYSGGTGSGAMMFKSKNPTVCSVSSGGIVSGLSIGECSVTVSKLGSGSYLDTTSIPMVYSISQVGLTNTFNGSTITIKRRAGMTTIKVSMPMKYANKLIRIEWGVRKGGSVFYGSWGNTRANSAGIATLSTTKIIRLKTIVRAVLNSKVIAKRGIFLK